MITDRFLLFTIIITTISTLIFFVFYGRGIDVNTNFESNVFIDNSGKNDAVIGFVNIKSSNFLPGRVYFKKYKGCVFNKNSVFTYNIYYSKNLIFKGSQFNELNTQNFVEVPTLSNLKMALKLSLEYPIITNNFNKRFYYSQIKSKNILYLYNSNETRFQNQKFPEFCNNVYKNQSFYHLNIKNSAK